LDAGARADIERWTRAYIEQTGAAVLWTECDARACAAAGRWVTLPDPPGRPANSPVSPPRAMPAPAARASAGAVHWRAPGPAGAGSRARGGGRPCGTAPAAVGGPRPGGPGRRDLGPGGAQRLGQDRTPRHAGGVPATHDRHARRTAAGDPGLRGAIPGIPAF